MKERTVGSEMNKFLLQERKIETPYFIFSREALLNNLEAFKTLFPLRTEICYAVKANAELPVLCTLKEQGASFEAASRNELNILKSIGVNSEKIVYGTAIKPLCHIKEFADYGVDRFAFDSEEELHNIASCSPQAKVYARSLISSDTKSVFNLSEKFGVTTEEAVRLLVKAQSLGLMPYGISFCVGSQAKNPNAWAEGIREIKFGIDALLNQGIKIQVINFGGGFPFNYENKGDMPSLAQIVTLIKGAIKTLPYNLDYIIEPGRALVADTFLLVTSIIAKAKRANNNWLYLDAGIYNALMEALTCQGSTKYRIESYANHPSAHLNKYILSGPTGDGLDVISRDAQLPVDIAVGDKLLIYDVGAYTASLATSFNGFPKPPIITI